MRISTKLHNKLHVSLLVIFISIFSISYYFFFDSSSSRVPKSPSKEDLNKIDMQFSTITGEHILLKGLAKRYINPSSYEHIETAYATNHTAKELMVKTYFYGENLLGARFKACITASYNYEGLLKAPPQECDSSAM